MLFISFLFYFSSVNAFLPYTNPPWTPTYDLASSTICMAINSTGPYNLTMANYFGIVSYDWSSEKAQWVLSRPMDCEERMLEEAILTKKSNPNGHVFVYRNLVKALPWFSSVRKIIQDPDYSGFFLKFKNGGVGSHVPVCTTDEDDQTKCSDFYHDQSQTPQVPNVTDPHPDGACNITCDCGSVPCGEYLFDHRNGSMLTEWLLKEYILSETALGSPFIDGLFIDDFWCSDIINGSHVCTDPVQGPSEIEEHSQKDMGLSDEDIVDITNGWLYNMQVVQQAILDAGGYTWSLIPDQDNANAMPVLVINSTYCLSNMNVSCIPNNPYLTAPLLAGITWNQTLNDFPFLEQQVASFLLMRGDYAYLGWGEWGMVWPESIPFPDLVWKRDYGVPIDTTCYKVGDGNVYQRKYSKAVVQIDCDTFQASIQSI